MSAAPSPVLVVGAGLAGLTIATRLRELGDPAPVTLVGAEADPPYERPPLSKAALSDAALDPTLRSREWLSENGIGLVLADPVVELDRDASGGVARTASGRVLEFGRLALATGAGAVSLPQLPTALTLRTRADAARLRERLTQASRVVVIGGGFLGLEVAAAARAHDLEVTVVEATDRLMGRAVSPVVSQSHRAWHQANGIRIVLQENASHVAELTGELSDDTVVVTCVGARPDTTLADRLGLEVVGGIGIDARCLASDRSTVAAGDCTLAPVSYVPGVTARSRLESVDGAQVHGARAAATLAGVDVPTRHVPWFWSDQGSLSLQIVGLPHLADHTVVRGNPTDGQGYSVIHFRDGLLVASECVNRPADHVVVKRLLESGRSLDLGRAGEIADPAVALRGLAM